jgi:hypothetical protein
MKPTEQPSPEDNLEQYKSYLANVVQSDGQSYLNAVKEGMEILKREEKSSKGSTIVPKTPPTSSTNNNPYKAAKTAVLAEMSQMEQQEIANMEAAGNTDHYRYNDFVRRIIEEAEKNC